MTRADDPATLALIEAARAEFAQSLTIKADALLGQANSGAWDDTRRAAHKLRGSAGVYGFAAVSAAAGAVEELLLRAGAEPDKAVCARAHALLLSLREEAVRAGRERP